MGETDSNNSTYYLQIVPMTYEEIYRMYMKRPKSELAQMLATRDTIWNNTVVTPFTAATYDYTGSTTEIKSDLK